MNGFNDDQVSEIIDLENINTQSVILVNRKAILQTFVSSKFLSIEEIDELKLKYDLIIHGISRILKLEEFLQALIKLALLGIKEITISDNKESETRLYREFHKEATSNLMLLTSLIDVKIGGILIKSESQVLHYASIASKTTSSSQMADIRKI